MGGNSPVCGGSAGVPGCSGHKTIRLSSGVSSFSEGTFGFSGLMTSSSSRSRSSEGSGPCSGLSGVSSSSSPPDQHRPVAEVVPARVIVDDVIITSGMKRNIAAVFFQLLPRSNRKVKLIGRCCHPSRVQVYRNPRFPRLRVSISPEGSVAAEPESTVII